MRTLTARNSSAGARGGSAGAARRSDRRARGKSCGPSFRAHAFRRREDQSPRRICGTNCWLYTDRVKPFASYKASRPRKTWICCVRHVATNAVASPLGVSHPSACRAPRRRATSRTTCTRTRATRRATSTAAPVAVLVPARAAAFADPDGGRRAARDLRATAAPTGAETQTFPTFVDSLNRQMYGERKIAMRDAASIYTLPRAARRRVGAPSGRRRAGRRRNCGCAAAPVRTLLSEAQMIDQAHQAAALVGGAVALFSHENRTREYVGNASEVRPAAVGAGAVGDGSEPPPTSARRRSRRLRCTPPSRRSACCGRGWLEAARRRAARIAAGELARARRGAPHRQRDDAEPGRGHGAARGAARRGRDRSPRGAAPPGRRGMPTQRPARVLTAGRPAAQQQQGSSSSSSRGSSSRGSSGAGAAGAARARSSKDAKRMPTGPREWWSALRQLRPAPGASGRTRSPPATATGRRSARRVAPATAGGGGRQRDGGDGRRRAAGAAAHGARRAARMGVG